MLKAAIKIWYQEEEKKERMETQALFKEIAIIDRKERKMLYQ